MAENRAEIIVGTYEDYVVGYQVNYARSSRKRAKMDSAHRDKAIETADTRISLEQSFALRAHSGSVRCLAVNSDGTFAISAGFDESINLLNLTKRKLVQTIDGPVNCATFAGKSHLICGCESGNVHIYEIKSSSISLEKTLKGHEASVSSLSVHPSNKVMLSLARDNTMRTWNLIKGRCAYITNIKSQAHLICWSKTGEEFIIAANNEIYLYKNSGILGHSIKVTKRINSIEFLTNNIFIVASDSSHLELFDLKECVSLMSFEAHNSRVKSVKHLHGAHPDIRFVTASSDGTVKLWSAGEQPGEDPPNELASADTGARLTCMTTVDHCSD